MTKPTVLDFYSALNQLIKSKAAKCSILMGNLEVEYVYPLSWENNTVRVHLKSGENIVIPEDNDKMSDAANV